MDITRFLDKPNTPVPIPRDASLMQEKCIIAGNLAMQELSVKKKERQRVTLQPRIKWTAQERFELGRLACQTSTENALTLLRSRGRPGAAGGPPGAAESIFRWGPVASGGCAMSEK